MKIFLALITQSRRAEGDPGIYNSNLGSGRKFAKNVLEIPEKATEMVLMGCIMHLSYDLDAWALYPEALTGCSERKG